MLIEKQLERGNRNGKENNCMDILSDKLTILHMKKHRYGLEKEI